MMKTCQWLIILGLLILVILAITGLVTTRGSNVVMAPSGSAATPNTASDQNTLVDQRPLQTARRMAALASTADEQRIAQDVLRVADHEVDLAFADALRDATQHPSQLSAEARQVDARLTKAEAAVKADQDGIAVLTKKLTGASEAQQDNLNQQIDIVKAQLELDQDEVDDARADLNRAGGNKQDRIQRLMDEHEATHTEAATAKAPQPANNPSADTLAAEALAWNALHQKRLQLTQARQDSQDTATKLAEAHNALEAKVQAETPAKKDVGRQAAENLKSAPRATLRPRRLPRQPRFRLCASSRAIKRIFLISTAASRIIRNSPTTTPAGSVWSLDTRGPASTASSSQCCGFCWWFSSYI